jgi:hypothetical protein
MNRHTSKFEERSDQRLDAGWDRLEASFDRFQEDILSGLERWYRTCLQIAVVAIFGSSILTYILLTLILR